MTVETHNIGIQMKRKKLIKTYMMISIEKDTLSMFYKKYVSANS